MRFPTIADIATKEVVTVGVDESISVAVESIYASEHRTALVLHDGKYFAFGASDLLKMGADGLDTSLPLHSLKLRRVPTVHKNKNVLDVLDIVDRPSECEQMAVVDEHNELYGIITHTDITNNIDPETLMENYRLKDFLKLGKRMKWIEKQMPTATLFKEIALHSFDNAIVVEDGIPIGIVTTKDVMRLVKEKVDLKLSIEHYMSKPIDTIRKDSSIKEALDFMRTKKYKRAVVVGDNGKLEGVITQKELISLTYSRWARLIKEYHEELNSINTTLEDKAQEYEKKAAVDSLTGLYNRSKFSELFNLAYKNMISRQSPLSLIMLDIDHFKKINDTYGHNKGDEVIVAIAKRLTTTLRNIDIVCRWGGEEFIALLPTANLEQTELIAQKIRESIEALGFSFFVSASFGVSEVRRGEGMLEAIERADKALYYAKESGRNRVVREDNFSV